MADSDEKWKKLFQDNRDCKSKASERHGDLTVAGLICTIAPRSGEIYLFQGFNIETFLIREFISFWSVFVTIGSQMCSVCISGEMNESEWMNKSAP